MNIILLIFAVFRLIDRGDLFPGLPINFDKESTGRRLKESGHSKIDSKDKAHSKDEAFLEDFNQYWLLIKIILVLVTFTCILIKTLMFLMIYDNFGKIVTLIKSIGPTIAPFLSFLLLILVFFTGCYRILGEDFACDTAVSKCSD